MGDRVAVLQAGVLQQYDTPRALYTQGGAGQRQQVAITESLKASLGAPTSP